MFPVWGFGACALRPCCELRYNRWYSELTVRCSETSSSEELSRSLLSLGRDDRALRDDILNRSAVYTAIHATLVSKCWIGRLVQFISHSPWVEHRDGRRRRRNWCYVASQTRGRGVGVRRSYSAGTSQSILHHCQGKCDWVLIYIGISWQGTCRGSFPNRRKPSLASNFLCMQNDWNNWSILSLRWLDS